MQEQYDLAKLNEEIGEKSEFVERLLAEVGRVVVGQEYMIERLLIGLLADGHVLLEGVPGLAKTLTVSSLAATIGTDFQRIQFTPDLLPADLIGTLIYNQRDNEFSIKKGPIFSNIILADEINRSPAKVQSALLECMQERQVTIGDETFQMDEPFLVLATQNPLEQQGTYPLPEAQVDRFMLKINVSYPNATEELEIMRRMARTGDKPAVQQVISVEEIQSAQSLLNALYIDERVERYIIDLVMASRYPDNFGLRQLTNLVEYGASPRASINLNLAARAHAFLQHRGYVTPEDIRSIAMDVLRHRIGITYEAEAEEFTAEQIVQTIMETVEVP